MANVRQQDTGSSAIVSHTAQIERDKAAARARADAEAERKRQAQKDAEAKAKADAEAARRKAEADAAAKRSASDAKIDQKKVATPAKSSANTSTSTGSKAPSTPAKAGKVDPPKTDKPTTNNKSELQDTLDGFMDYAKELFTETSDMYGYTPVQTMDAIMPTLRSAKELADLYGLDYNLDNIYNTLMKSTDAGYAARYAQQDITDDKYYDNAATAQNTLMDTLDQQRSQAILSGTNRGMQAAQALSTMLGTSQQFAVGANQNAADRGLIGKEYASAKAQTGVNALTQYNTMGQQLGDISKSLYSSDSSSYAAQLGYNADVNTANSTMQASQMQAQSSLQSNLTNSMADIWNNYNNGKISLAQAQMQADAAIKSSQINANANTAAANIAAQTNANNLAASTTANQQNNANGLISNIASGIYTTEAGYSILDGMLATGSIDKNIYDNTKAYLGTLKQPTAPTASVAPIAPKTTTGGTTLYGNDPLSPNAGGGYKY